MRVQILWLIPLFVSACSPDAVLRSSLASRRWASVSASGMRACGLTIDGNAWCWGPATSDPVPVEGVPALRSIAIGTRVCTGDEVRACPSDGAAHTCGIDDRGLAWCWGSNDRGQLGDGTTVDRDRPAYVTGAIRFRSIRAGNGFSCGVGVDSIAYCWGYNGHGNLGFGIADSAAHPVPRAIARGVAMLATGSDHACGIDGEGRAFCWGDDFRARLGSDAARLDGPSFEPVPVNGVHRFAAISAGLAHACGLTPAGSAFCWGSNADGELGRARPSFRRDPVAVITPALASLSEGAASHTCGLTANGRAWCWGSDANGQLGSARSPPDCRTSVCPTASAPVDTRSRFGSLATGRDFTCGVTLTHHLLCWGMLPPAFEHPGRTDAPFDIAVPRNRRAAIPDATRRPGMGRGYVNAPGNSQ